MFARISWAMSLLMLLVVADAADEIDYCTLPCNNGAKNICCNPKKHPNVSAIDTDDIELFRSAIVFMHNDLRHCLASSKNDHKCEEPLARTLKTGTAANMNSLSYDMELEKLARCWCMSGLSVRESRDKCRRSARFQVTAGQNQVIFNGTGGVHDLPLFKTWMARGVTNFYTFNKSGISRRTIDSFDRKQVPNIAAVEPFTLMMWATITHVGCARCVRDDGGRRVKFRMACDYAGPNVTPNKPKQPVYIRGPPCTRCPEGRRCIQNKRYSDLHSLCQEFEEDEEDEAVEDQGTSEGRITAAEKQVKAKVVETTPASLVKIMCYVILNTIVGKYMMMDRYIT